MKTSDKGIEFIRGVEGERLDVYLDTAGIPTIGVGHVIKKGEPNHISSEQSTAYLVADVKTAEEAVNKLVKIQLTQNQFDALVSFTFNLGEPALAGSTLLKMLNGNDVQAAANQFSRWNKNRQKGRLVENKGLTNRRAKEANLFLNGVYK